MKGNEMGGAFSTYWERWGGGFWSEEEKGGDHVEDVLLDGR